MLAALLGTLLFAAAQGYLSRSVTRLIGEKLGRELHADGGLRIGFGRVIHVTAMGVRLANAAWATPEDMLRAGRVDVEIDAGSLFRDTVIVRELTADGVELNLQRNAKGENNWTFRPRPKAARTALPVVFESVSIPAARVTLMGPRLERPLEVSLEALAQRVRADGMLVLRATGAANGAPLELQVDSGPLKSLIPARDFLVNARGRLGDIALGLDTHVDSLATLAESQLALRLDAPEASYFASRLGLRDFGQGPVALTLAVSPRPAGAGLDGKLAGQLGEFDVAAEGSLTMKEPVPDFSIKGHVVGPDLSRVGTIIGTLTGVHGLPSEPFRLQLDVQRSGDTLQVRNATLELKDARVEADGALDSAHGMAGSAVTFKASATDIASLGRRFRLALPLRGPLDLSGSVRLMRPRELRIDCRGTTQYGNFTAVGPVQLAPKGVGTRLTWTAGGSEAAALGALLAVPDPPRGKFNGQGDIEWTRDGLLLRGVSIQAGGEAASIAGKLGRPALGRGADLQMDISGPSAARMLGRFGYPGFPAARYQVAGRIQRQSDRTVLSAVSVKLGDSSARLDGILGAAPDFVATDLSFELSGSALGDYAGLLPKITLPRGPFRASGRVLKPGAAVLRLDKLQLAVGKSSATISADLDLPLARRSLRYELEASVPEPSALLPDSDLAEKVGKPLQLAATGARAGDSWSVERVRISSDRGLLSTQGALTIVPQLASAGTQVELRAPNFGALGELFRRHWPELPIELHGKFSRSEQELRLDAAEGRLGGKAFKGHFVAHGLQGKPDLDVEVELAQLDLNQFLKRPAIAKTVAKNRATTSPSAKSPPSTSAGTRDRVIPDAEVSMPHLGSYTGRLAVRVGDLRVSENELTDFQLQANLRDGRLRVDPIAATGPGGSVNLKGTLAAKGKGISVQLAGSGSELRLRPVPIAFGGPDASRFTANVELQAEGSRWSELAATLNGRLRLVGRGGHMKNSLVMASASGFVQQLLVAINPMATRQPTTDVDCSVYLLRAKDGIVTTDPAIVMRTREVDIVSGGSVDLHTEKVDFNFKIKARTGLGFGISQLVNPYLKVNGTLAHPGVTLDPTGTLVNGSAAFATAGLSVVATTLWDRFVHEKDPCGAAVAESDRRAAQESRSHAQP